MYGVDHIGLCIFCLFPQSTWCYCCFYFFFIRERWNKSTSGSGDWHYSWIFDKFSSANLLTAIFYLHLLTLTQKKRGWTFDTVSYCVQCWSCVGRWPFWCQSICIPPIIKAHTPTKSMPFLANQILLYFYFIILHFHLKSNI